MKKITIDEKDVYRSKHESVTEQESIFYESYNKARRVLEEIIRNSEEVTRTNCDINRVTNNIILFNAERGQGKTTAMRSFSAFLEEQEKTAKSLQTEAKFITVDMIDPSGMNNQESIVRVVLTYLFSMIKPKLKKIKANQSIEKNYKIKILESFQRCYDFVDYLNGLKTNKDFMPDDMEYISKLGNSHELKKELYYLIDNIIKLEEYNENFANKPGTPFLVLGIDDADLSTSSTFKLCDEIRSYFSLPNLVVIMAADMNHLMDNVYEEYLSKSNLKDERSQDKCKHMAIRYVEKIFPQGHVIRLPKMDELLLNHSTKIVLEYRGNNKISEIENYDKGNLQDQILGTLFKNTGILLIRPKDKLHSFLPHSMRELTHFVKMLCDMETIDFIKILECYVTRDFDESAQRELDKARDNMNAVSQYFLDYWCSIHLEETDADNIRAMYLMSLDDSKYRLMKDMEQINNGKIDNKTIAEFIYELGVGTGMERKQVAYSIFYTIYSFLRLYDLLGNEDLMKKFLDFSCDEFDFMKCIRNYSNQDGEKNYQVFQYSIDNSLIKGSIIKGHSLPATIKFINMFTNTAKTGRNAFRLDKNSKNKNDKQLIASKNIDDFEFDLMKSIKKLLYNAVVKKLNEDNFGNNNDTLEGVLEVLKTSRNIQDLDRTSEKNIFVDPVSDMTISLRGLYTIMIYICNIELQKYIDEGVYSCMQAVNYNQDLIQIYSNVLEKSPQHFDGPTYRTFDETKNQFLYMEDLSHIGHELITIFNANANILCNLFLSNEGNLRKISDEYRNILLSNVQKIMEKLETNDDVLNTEILFNDFKESLQWELEITQHFSLQGDTEIVFDELKEIFNSIKKVREILRKIEDNCIVSVRQKNNGAEVFDFTFLDDMERKRLEYINELQVIREEYLDKDNRENEEEMELDQLY